MRDTLKNRIVNLEEKQDFRVNPVVNTATISVMAELEKQSPEYIGQLIEKFEANMPTNSPKNPYVEEVHRASILSLQVLLHKKLTPVEAKN